MVVYFDINNEFSTLALGATALLFPAVRRRAKNPEIDAFWSRLHVMQLDSQNASTTLAIASICFRKGWSHCRKSSDVVAIVALPSPPARRGPQSAAHSQPSSALPLSFKPTAYGHMALAPSPKVALSKDVCFVLAWEPLLVCCCRKSFACFVSPRTLRMWADSFTDTSPTQSVALTRPRIIHMSKIGLSEGPRLLFRAEMACAKCGRATIHG